jgi:hypothetical protein
MQYGLNMETGEGWFWRELNLLTERERSLMMYEFLQAHNQLVVEYFVLTSMPDSFVAEFEKKRTYNTKEAFRRAMRKLFTNTDPYVPIVERVKAYIKETGSFTQGELAKVLGRTPQPQEMQDIQDFLNTLSNEDIQKLFTNNPTNQGAKP